MYVWLSTHINWTTFVFLALIGIYIKINILIAIIIPYLVSLAAIQTIVKNILQENGVKYRLNLKRMWFLSQTDIEYPCAKLFCRIYIFFPVLCLGLGGKYEILQIDKSQRT